MRNRTGAPELGLLVALFAVVARFADEVTFWPAAGLVVVAVVAGMASLVGEARPWRWPIDAVALPALATFGSLGIVRLVEPGPWLAVVGVAAFVVVSWVVRLELRRAAAAQAAVGFQALAQDPDLAETLSAESTPARLAAFGLVFASLAAIGGIVPGGVAANGQSVTVPAFLATIVLDVAVAILAGYRILALRPHGRNDVLAASYLYLLTVAPAGVLIRVLALPRLFGPAILTLAFYIVTSLRESDEPVRFNARLLEETAILVLAGAALAMIGLVVR